jgi:hypothetical protein
MSRFFGLLLCALVSTGAMGQETDYTAAPGSILKITMPTASGGGPCVNAVPPADITILLQGCVNSQSNVNKVSLGCGDWTISSTISNPAGPMLIEGIPGCTRIHIPSGVVAFTCSGSSSYFGIRGVDVLGTAPNYVPGNWQSIGNANQGIVHTINCPIVDVYDVRGYNIAGVAFNCEYPASGFNIPSTIRFRTLTVFNSYQDFVAQNSCEYAMWTDLIGRNNIWGVLDKAGNSHFSNFILVDNYNNFQVDARGAANPCHGNYTSGQSNHGADNLQVLSCPLGITISGVDFIGDYTGSLTPGNGQIGIDSSTGVNIMGGMMGSIIAITGTNGAHKLEGAYIRDTIPGFTNPSGPIELKLNFDASGQWPQNN